MAKGLLKHQERLSALNLLGKDLARRAKSKCELCEVAGVPLKIYEVSPVPDEPDLEHCLMTCDTCREQLGHYENKPKNMHVDHWRCLGKNSLEPFACRPGDVRSHTATAFRAEPLVGRNPGTCIPGTGSGRMG